MRSASSAQPALSAPSMRASRPEKAGDPGRSRRRAPSRRPTRARRWTARGRARQAAGTGTAERVADEVRRAEAGLVHGGLHRVDKRLLAGLTDDRRAARMPGQPQGQDVVPALERGQDELPRPPRVDEAAQADHRRSGAAAVRGREGRVRAAHCISAGYGRLSPGVRPDWRCGEARLPSADDDSPAGRRRVRGNKTR
jgi:hypothetical protein